MSAMPTGPAQAKVLNIACIPIRCLSSPPLLGPVGVIDHQ
jgi:hypothetical protein